MTKSYAANALNEVKEWNHLGQIPSKREKIIAERLLDFCGIRNQERPRWKEHYHMKCHQVLQSIYAANATLVLPFAVHIPLTAYAKINVVALLDEYDKAEGPPLLLTNSAKIKLTEIAEKEEITSNSQFLELMAKLFPSPLFEEDLWSSLESLANKYGFANSTYYLQLKGELFRNAAIYTQPIDCFSYCLTNLNSVRTVFGSYMADAIETSKTVLTERTAQSTVTHSESVRVHMPLSGGDTMFFMDVDVNKHAITTLFPSLDRDRLFLYYRQPQAASLTALETVFNDQVLQAIQDSERWRLEQQHGVTNVTKCVTLEIGGPSHTVLHLLMKGSMTRPFLEQLYNDEVP